MVDPYAILGVDEGDPPDVIRAAYRELELDHHPDRHLRASRAERVALHESMAAITAAFRMLDDANELSALPR